MYLLDFINALDRESDTYRVKANRRGFTLIELIVTLAILLIALTILFPMLNLFQTFSDRQVKESSQRFDVMDISTLITNDVHFSKKMVVEDEGRSLLITSKQDEMTSYRMESSAGNPFLVINRADGASLKFPEIKDAEFSLNSRGDLVSVKLTTDITTVDEKYTGFKVSKWDYTLVKNGGTPESDPVKIIKNLGITLFGMPINFIGHNLLPANNDILTAYVQGDWRPSSGGSIVALSNIYINGDINTIQDTKIGNPDYPGIIQVNNNFTINGGSKQDVYGRIYVKNKLTTNNAGILTGPIYAGGDVWLSGGANVKNKLYTKGNFDIRNAQLNGPLFCEGNATFDGGAKVNGNIYINGSALLMNTIINGQISCKGDVTLNGGVEIKNQLFTTGNVSLDNTKITGTLYCDGDITSVTWSTQVYGEVYYTGTMPINPKANTETLNRFHKISRDEIPWPEFFSTEIPQTEFSAEDVTWPEFPIVNMPELQSADWYVNQGYSIKTESSWRNKESNQKVYAKNNFYYDVTLSVSNIIIIGEKDVTIGSGGGYSLKGKNLIFAPNGKVTINLTGSKIAFEGLIIAKEIALNTGGEDVIVRRLEEIIPDPKDYPFK